MRRATKDQYTRQSETIQKFLGEIAKEQGKASAFVKRRSKMTAEVFAQTMILGMLENPEATLNDLVQISARLGVEISEPGLHERVNDSAVELMKGLLGSSLKHFVAHGDVSAEVLACFTSVDILDSTQIILPAALAEDFAGHNSPGTEAALKMHLSMDYRSGNLRAIQFRAGREPDQACDLAAQLVRPGSLQLFDLGYMTLKRLQQIEEAGAYFLTPFKARMNVYAHPDDTEPVELAKWLDAHANAKGEVDEWVYVGADVRLPVRLVAWRFSQAQAERRRRRARRNARKKRRGVSRRHLRLLGWGMLISNLPAALDAKALVTLYRVRWQIELLFKLCKSHFRLAAVRPWRRERLLCQIYARLIGVVLFQWLIVPWRFVAQGELSPTKAYRIVRRQALAIVHSLRAEGAGLSAILAEIGRDFMRYALKSPRNKSPSTFDLLRQLDVQIA